MATQVVYPTFDEYQAVLQHPQQCFSKLTFLDGKIEQDLWGLPRVRSGGFALTYRMERGNTSYAIRCFHRNVPSRYRRYQIISSYLAKIQSPYFVDARYQTKGIQVGSKWYPITIMPWIQGESIESYIFKNLSHSEVISRLAIEFLEMIRHLQAAGIAHGDLSHQNIMVRQGQLVLIDYDGMYVPGMEKMGSVEIGHSHFQHPSRTFGQYDQNLDRFSSIVIYLALSALAVHPELWKKYESAGDGLLFRKADFLSPFTSPLLQELETLSSMRKMVGLFRTICLCTVDQVPTLEQFIEGNVRLNPAEEKLEIQGQHLQVEKPLDASVKFQMGRKLGQIVTVIGRVTEVFEGQTRDGQAHIFINFGNWRSKCFTIVLWGDAYKIVKETPDLAPEKYLDCWVSVHGMLTSYKNRFQIAMDEPFGIEVLSDEEAYQRLGEKPIYRDQFTVPVLPFPENSDKQLSQVKKSPITPDLEKLGKYSDFVANRIDELYRNKK